MFMPFNYMGFGYTGGFYAPPCCCCNPFGLSPFVTNPFFTNMVIYNPFTMTNLCSVPSYNYNFQNSFNYQTPDISAFIPKMDFSQYITQPTQILSMNGFYDNLLSTISKNVLGSYQHQVTQTPEESKEKASVYAPQEKPKDISYDAQKLETKWKNSKFAKQSNCKLKDLPSEFFQKVVDVSKKINCNPDDLMAVMNFESAGTFSASVKNPKSTATGLIQFMDSTAKGLGTTCAALAQMTETQQLEYVEKHFLNWKKTHKMGNDYLDLATLYALVLAPGHAKRDVLYSLADNKTEYESNIGLDLPNPNNNNERDGKITKAEAARRVMNCLA